MDATLALISGSISTHALREEGDVGVGSQCAKSGNFYPRPPRGGRPERRIALIDEVLFLPTPSARRATDDRPSPGRRAR